MSNVLSLAFTAALVPVSLTAGGGGNGLPKDPVSVFKRIDANPDGKVSKEEFTRLREQLSEKAKTTSKNEQFTEKLFSHIDENKDGYITLDEFKKFRAKTAAKLKERNDKQSSDVSEQRTTPPPQVKS
jgi:hypothetical protein